MKFLIFLLKISLLTHYFFATASQIRQYDVISFETPKGASLNNIYGKTFLDSPPTSSITQINVIGPNGMVETVYQNTSMLNTPQDNLCLFRDEPTIKLCESLSCDLCMASKKCGWCGESSKCIPGNNRRVACEKDCLSSWIFSDNLKCQSIVKSGNLNNIAPESTKLINPNLAEPKLAINMITPNVVDHKIKVKYGEQHVNEVKSFTTNDGSIHTIQENSVKPLIGEIHHEVVVNNRIETKYVSLTNGTELKKDGNLTTFGLDTLNNNTLASDFSGNSTSIDTSNVNKENKTENSFLK